MFSDCCRLYKVKPKDGCPLLLGLLWEAAKIFCAHCAEHEKNQWLKSENNGLRKDLKSGLVMRKAKSLSSPERNFREAAWHWKKWQLERKRTYYDNKWRNLNVKFSRNSKEQWQTLSRSVANMKMKLLNKLIIMQKLKAGTLSAGIN